MSDELYTEASTATELILFYDGGCPLCVHEMRQLKALDQKRKQRLQFEDIWAHGFAKHRNRIFKLITGKERCLQCSLDE